MFDQDKAESAVQQIHQGLQALNQAFASEDADEWLSWPPVALDMMLIANARLEAIQEMGVALEEDPLLIPDFQCAPRLYLIDADGGLFAIMLPSSVDTEEFNRAFDALVTAISNSSHDYELWIVEGTHTRMIELPGTGTRLADEFFDADTITEE
jgi:hypothetical protein